jgi:hypothetical protein
MRDKKNMYELVQEKRFALLEDFLVKTEQKENPRKMPYIYLSNQQITEEGISFGAQKIAELISSMGKEVVTMNEVRKFLKNGWPRDNYLYFNGIYFPYRFLDGEGRYRTEYEALVTNRNFKNELEFSKTSRIHKYDPIIAVGEGGGYFPDHDNNTLFVSKGIIINKKRDTEYELDDKIKRLHRKIFGDNVNIIIIPSPEGTSHIDTHLTVLPNTKIVFVENNYYHQ